MTFSEGSQGTGVGTQENANPIKDVVSLGRGRLPHPHAPGRSHAHWSNAKQGAGSRARRGGLSAISESGVGAGISLEKPSGGSCGGSPGTVHSAPAQRRAGKQLRKVKEQKEAERLQSGWGSALRLGRARCVLWEPGSRSPVLLVEQPVHREAS